MRGVREEKEEELEGGLRDASTCPRLCEALQLSFPRGGGERGGGEGGEYYLPMGVVSSANLSRIVADGGVDVVEKKRKEWGREEQTMIASQWRQTVLGERCR